MDDQSKAAQPVGVDPDRLRAGGEGLEVNAPQMAGDTTAAAPDRDRVAMRAYELYLARGASDGAALDDWLTAERELSPANSDRTNE